MLFRSDLSEKLVEFADKLTELENDLEKADGLQKNMQNYADFFKDVILTDMNALREIGDYMETQTGSEYWPYPSYGEMLFGV